MRRTSITALALIALTVLIGPSCLDQTDHIDPLAQLAEDIQTIDNHLAANGITAIPDKSGIRLSVTSVGTKGFPPRPNQSVKVKYKGSILSGSVFEQSTIEGSVAGFIQGWQRALPMLPEGSKAVIYVPSGLAYGRSTVGPIPPNSNLVFEVEIMDVIVSPSEGIQAGNDVSLIDDYLEENQIDAISDTTGVRYIITTEGTGNKPSWYSKVKFSYKGKLLSNGTEFITGTADRSDEVDSFLVDYINGIKFALTKLSKGGKGTFYIPSGLAFGPNQTSAGTTTIPSNSNIIYELELLEIYPD